MPGEINPEIFNYNSLIQTDKQQKEETERTGTHGKALHAAEVLHQHVTGIKFYFQLHSLKKRIIKKAFKCKKYLDYLSENFTPIKIIRNNLHKIDILVVLHRYFISCPTYR